LFRWPDLSYLRPNRTPDYQGLILIVIGGLTPKKEEEMLNELDCDNLINFFASQKA